MAVKSRNVRKGTSQGTKTGTNTGTINSNTKGGKLDQVDWVADDVGESSGMRPRISAELTGRINDYADSIGVPVTAVINLAIAELLSRNGRPIN